MGSLGAMPGSKYFNYKLPRELLKYFNYGTRNYKLPTKQQNYDFLLVGGPRRSV